MLAFFEANFEFFERILAKNARRRDIDIRNRTRVAIDDLIYTS